MGKFEEGGEAISKGKLTNLKKDRKKLESSGGSEYDAKTHPLSHQTKRNSASNY